MKYNYNFPVYCLSVLFFLVIAVIPKTSLSSQILIKPSFDCEKAKSDVEKLICADGNLALNDLILNDLYKIAVKNPKYPKLREEQRAWVKNTRNKTCANQSTYVAANLNECYRRRIRELYNITGHNEALILKYKKILFNDSENEALSKMTNPAKKFVAEYNQRSQVINILGECSGDYLSIYFWDNKRLLARRHSDSVECTGRSVHYFSFETYCHVGDGFVQSSSFFDCGEKRSDEYILNLSKLYLENKIQSILGDATNKKDFLGKLLQAVKNTRNPYLTDSLMYSKGAMNFASSNVDNLYLVLKPYREQVLEILSDLILTHDSIIKTPEWEDKFNNYVPYEANHYMDTEYIPISNGFNLDPTITHGYITGYVQYSYQELYHRVWYKAYKQGAMKEMHAAISKLYKLMQDDQKPAALIEAG